LTVNKIDITSAIADVKNLLESAASLSKEARSMFNLMLLIVELLINKIGINSSNSSKAPSSDPNRVKESKKSSDKKPRSQVARKVARVKI